MTQQLQMVAVYRKVVDRWRANGETGLLWPVFVFLYAWRSPNALLVAHSALVQAWGVVCLQSHLQAFRDISQPRPADGLLADIQHGADFCIGFAFVSFQQNVRTPDEYRFVLSGRDIRFEFLFLIGQEDNFMFSMTPILERV